MNEEKPRSFKLQKNVSTRQHGWTALISLVLGVIFFGSVIGAILLVLGIVSGIIWLFRIIKGRKAKNVSVIKPVKNSNEDKTEKSDILQIDKKDIKKFVLLIGVVVLIGIGISIYYAIRENNRKQDEIQSEQHKMNKELEYQNCLLRQQNGENIGCRKPRSLGF
jgi:hypothetical protein